MRNSAARNSFFLLFLQRQKGGEKIESRSNSGEKETVRNEQSSKEQAQRLPTRLHSRTSAEKT